MKEFLVSKEGRGTLIAVIVVIAITLGVGYYVWGAIFASDENQRTTAEDIAGGGSSTVSTRGQQDIRADLTSENMTEEARGIADEFNQQSATDDSLHPIPTANDVQRVAVPGVPQESQDQRSELEQATDIEPLAPPPGVPTQADSRQRNEADRNRQNVSRQRQRMAEEMMRARRDAASGLIQTYEQPPASASMAFTSGNNGEGQGDTLARVARNEDGDTEFQRSETNAQQASECDVPLLRGGDIRYAVNGIALNTDFEGPVKVEFLDGKIKGWIGMGSFQLNEFGAKMKVMVERLIDPTGRSHDVTGYVLDPETTLWATRSDVDYHIIYRYGGYGLGTVLAGFSELAEARKTRSERVGPNGATQTEYREPDGKQITWTLLGAFSELWETAFKDNINRPITVTLDPNEELGVLFEDSLCLSESHPATKLVQTEQIRRAGFSDPVQ
jgi:cytoskeletal protein RodZ